MKKLISNPKKVISALPHKKLPIKELKQDVKLVLTKAKKMISFLLLIYFYILELIAKTKFVEKIDKNQKAAQFFHRINSKLDYSTQTISQRELIWMALKNMWYRKNRTLITVGGMMVSILAIVFLLALGYGVQKLVVNQVADLNEMEQIDVLTQAGNDHQLNDRTMKRIEQIEFVENVEPIISVVGKLNYKQSETDLAVYGVTTNYLNQSTLNTLAGNYFDNDQLITKVSISPDDKLQIKEIGESIKNTNFGLKPGKWAKVRQQPNLESEVIGYTRSQGNKFSGEEVWGESYSVNIDEVQAVNDQNESLNPWLKAEFPIWQYEAGEYQPVLNEQGDQVKQKGYVTKTNIASASDSELQIKRVGEKWVEMFPNEEKRVQDVYTTSLPDRERVMLINRAALTLIDAKPQEAIDQTVKLDLIATEGYENQEQMPMIKSGDLDYKVFGVTNDKDNPIIYVPFIDLREMGISYYSQLKVTAESRKAVPIIRQKIESMGYATASILDTIDKIDNLFRSLRIILALIGSVALLVAGLGMFNTLTVSLLERTKEVGAMKAMGVTSEEVYRLFIVESTVMGTLGGFLGLVAGLGFSKILELLLSLFLIFKQVGYLRIVSLPLHVVLLILGVSFLVGFLTGLYPARRAKKISALNALRYE